MTAEKALCGEIITLVLQLLGTFAVAWAAVNWAFSRFKKEKLWERRIAAYTDVLTALGAMKLILVRQADDMEGIRNYSDEAKIALAVC